MGEPWHLKVRRHQSVGAAYGETQDDKRMYFFRNET